MAVHEWHEGAWLNEPDHRLDPGGRLVMTAEQGSDFWRRTSYGFTRDSGHALLWPLAPGRAVEATVVADLTHLYDQAGLLVRVDEETWVKAGLEFTDGAVHLSTVVTRSTSDWSAAPVPGWAGREVTVRASRLGDAVTIRVRPDGGRWVMSRLAPLDPAAPALAGPYCCSPERAGFEATFVRVQEGPADAGLHEPPP
jgi:hypothetical protein